MKKNSTVTTGRKQIFKQPRLTIGLDLGDRSSYFCMLDEVGNVILEDHLPTTPNRVRQVFSKMPRCRIALETGTHSPWVSRELSQMGHVVPNADANNLVLFGFGSQRNRLNETWLLF